MPTKVETRIQLGQCIKCGKPLGELGDTTRRCAKHAKEHSRKQSERQNRERSERARDNKCLYCDAPAEKDTCCQFHSDRRKYNQRDYEARKAGRPAPPRPK